MYTSASVALCQGGATYQDAGDGMNLSHMGQLNELRGDQMNPQPPVCTATTAV